MVDLRIVNPCAADSDGDGANNCIDGCPNDPARTAPGLCGCNVPAAVQGGGDVNRDTRLDGRDIDAFARELLAPTVPSERACAADADHNGTVNAADLSPFVSTLLAAP